MICAHFEQRNEKAVLLGMHAEWSPALPPLTSFNGNMLCGKGAKEGWGGGGERVCQGGGFLSCPSLFRQTLKAPPTQPTQTNPKLKIAVGFCPPLRF